MSVPVMDHNASLLWALWHNIDQSEMVPLSEELDRADTLSVRSEAPYKHTPTYAFPSRKSQYPETTRLKAMQNEVRTRYCSTLPDKDKSEDTQLLTVHAKPSTLCDPSESNRLYHSDTFLTEMPEYLSNEAENEGNGRMCMPAFLPTIQAKTHSKNRESRQSSAVRRYLERNDLLERAPPTTPCGYSLEAGDYKRLRNLEQALIPYDPPRARTHKPKREKPAKYKTKYKATGNKKKRVGKLYTGRDRESSTTSIGSNRTSKSWTNSQHYDSLITPQEELISHFSRISMRQVQATLNSNKMAILPSIT